MTGPVKGKERVQLSTEELRILLLLTLEKVRSSDEPTAETVVLGSALVKLGRALDRIVKEKLELAA